MQMQQLRQECMYLHNMEQLLPAVPKTSVGQHAANVGICGGLDNHDVIFKVVLEHESQPTVQHLRQSMLTMPVLS